VLLASASATTSGHVHFIVDADNQTFRFEASNKTMYIDWEMTADADGMTASVQVTGPTPASLKDMQGIASKLFLGDASSAVNVQRVYYSFSVPNAQRVYWDPMVGFGQRVISAPLARASTAAIAFVSLVGIGAIIVASFYAYKKYKTRVYEPIPDSTF